MRYVAALLIVAALAASPGRGDDRTDAGACAAINDDAKRLACYDALFRNPQGQFGVEKRAVPKEEVQELRAKVVQVARHARGEYELTLDNGQVWVQSEVKKQLVFKPGDEVLIRRATLGSFRLQHVDRSTSTTVTRVR